MIFIHEKEANSILTKSGLKHLVAVTPSFSNPYFLAYVLGALKNRLIDMILLSTHNICFD